MQRRDNNLSLTWNHSNLKTLHSKTFFHSRCLFTQYSREKALTIPVMLLLIFSPLVRAAKQALSLCKTNTAIFFKTNMTTVAAKNMNYPSFSESSAQDITCMFFCLFEVTPRLGLSTPTPSTGDRMEKDPQRYTELPHTQYCLTYDPNRQRWECCRYLSQIFSCIFWLSHPSFLSPPGVQDRPDHCYEAAWFIPAESRGLLWAGRSLAAGVGERGSSPC